MRKNLTSFMIETMAVAVAGQGLKPIGKGLWGPCQPVPSKPDWSTTSPTVQALVRRGLLAWNDPATQTRALPIQPTFGAEAP